MSSWESSPHGGVSTLIRGERDTRVSLCAGWRYCKKSTICKSERELSPELKLVGTLISDFLASRTGRNKCLLPSRTWYFIVTATLTKRDYFSNITLSYKHLIVYQRMLLEIALCSPHITVICREYPIEQKKLSWAEEP